MSEKSRNFKPDVIRWQFSRMWNCRWNFAQICHPWYYIRRFITPICTTFSKLETFIIIIITGVKQGYGENYHKATREIERALVFYVNICLVWHLTRHALYRSQRWCYILRVKKSPRLLFQVEYNWSIQAWSSDTFMSLPSFCWDQWVSDRHMIEI